MKSRGHLSWLQLTMFIQGQTDTGLERSSPPHHHHLPKKRLGSLVHFLLLPPALMEEFLFSFFREGCLQSPELKTGPRKLTHLGIQGDLILSEVMALLRSTQEAPCPGPQSCGVWWFPKPLLAPECTAGCLKAPHPQSVPTPSYPHPAPQTELPAARRT